MLPSISLVKDKMIVKLKPTLSQREYAYIVDNTRSIVQGDDGASLLERKSLVNSIDDAQLALDIYFYILSILCCILLFFATSVSLKYWHSYLCVLIIHIDLLYVTLHTKSVFFNH